MEVLRSGSSNGVMITVTDVMDRSQECRKLCDVAVYYIQSLDWIYSLADQPVHGGGLD